MNIHTLDLIFPFFVFAYGALVTTVLNLRVFTELAERRLPQPLMNQLEAHRWLALFCLVVGGLWSLQNVWLAEVSF